MKKLGIVLSLAALAGFASAKDLYQYQSEDLYKAEEHPITALQIGLADPLQIFPRNWTVAGLRLNIFDSNNYDFYGIDLGLVGLTGDDFYGLGVNLANWVDGDQTGLQIGALFNVGNGNAAGCEIASFANYTRNVFSGFQTALVNHNGAFYGFQIGALNWDKGISYGAQLGVANVNVNDFHGWSIGVFNYSERQRGVQFGAVNVIDETGYGVQIGVFNAAAKFQGIQIGVLNFIGNAEVAVLPIVNAAF